MASRSAPKLEGDEVRSCGGKNAHLETLSRWAERKKVLTRPITFKGLRLWLDYGALFLITADDK